MAQEFTINSSAIEQKINQLLPSQGGSGAGIDFSASTMVIPIVDLTETAEGSDVRPDLQTSLSLNTATPFDVTGATSTIITTTGYWRVVGVSSIRSTGGGARKNTIQVSDGTTAKNVWEHHTMADSNEPLNFVNVDVNVFLKAGDSLAIGSSSSGSIFAGSIRQIADVNGNLVNP